MPAYENFQVGMYRVVFYYVLLWIIIRFIVCGFFLFKCICLDTLRKAFIHSLCSVSRLPRCFSKVVLPLCFFNALLPTHFFTVYFRIRFNEVFIRCTPFQSLLKWRLFKVHFSVHENFSKCLKLKRNSHIFRNSRPLLIFKCELLRLIYSWQRHQLYWMDLWVTWQRTWLQENSKENARKWNTECDSNESVEATEPGKLDQPKCMRANWCFYSVTQ